MLAANNDVQRPQRNPSLNRKERDPFFLSFRRGCCFDPRLHATASMLQRMTEKNDVSACSFAHIFRCTAYPFGIDHAYVKISSSRYLLRDYVECFIGALRMNGGAVH